MARAEAGRRSLAGKAPLGWRGPRDGQRPVGWLGPPRSGGHPRPTTACGRGTDKRLWAKRLWAKRLWAKRLWAKRLCQAPVGQAPVGQAPVGQGPVGQGPLGLWAEACRRSRPRASQIWRACGPRDGQGPVGPLGRWDSRGQGPPRLWGGSGLPDLAGLRASEADNGLWGLWDGVGLWACGMACRGRLPPRSGGPPRPTRACGASGPSGQRPLGMWARDGQGHVGPTSACGIAADKGLWVQVRGQGPLGRRLPPRLWGGVCLPDLVGLRGRQRPVG